MKSDMQLQQDVMTELKWEPSVNATDILVVVQQGVVTLSGHVTNYAEKVAAEHVSTTKIVDGDCALGGRVS
jgi:osmotically-inducible protein OsmY